SDTAWVDGIRKDATLDFTSVQMTGPDPDLAAGNVLRTYVLGYDVSSATGRDRLTSVQECDGDALNRENVRQGRCKRPTTFQYAADQPTLHHYPYPGTPFYTDDSLWYRTVPRVGDLNGDGYDDTVCQFVHLQTTVQGVEFSYVFKIRLSDGQKLGPEIEAAT